MSRQRPGAGVPARRLVQHKNIVRLCEASVTTLSRMLHGLAMDGSGRSASEHGWGMNQVQRIGWPDESMANHCKRNACLPMRRAAYQHPVLVCPYERSNAAVSRRGKGGRRFVVLHHEELALTPPAQAHAGMKPSIGKYRTYFKTRFQPLRFMTGRYPINSCCCNAKLIHCPKTAAHFCC